MMSIQARLAAGAGDPAEPSGAMVGPLLLVLRRQLSGGPPSSYALLRQLPRMHTSEVDHKCQKITLKFRDSGVANIRRRAPRQQRATRGTRGDAFREGLKLAAGSTGTRDEASGPFAAIPCREGSSVRLGPPQTCSVQGRCGPRLDLTSTRSAWWQTAANKGCCVPPI